MQRGMMATPMGLVLHACLLCLLVLAASSHSRALPVRDEFINKMLSTMTLKEKIGQMTQVSRIDEAHSRIMLNYSAPSSFPL